MKISTKGRYALRMIYDLALHNEDGFVSLKDIAAFENVVCLDDDVSGKNFLYRFLHVLHFSGKPPLFSKGQICPSP